MTDPALRSKFGCQSMIAHLHNGQAAATAYVRAESAKWKPIIVTLDDLSNR